jgi:hypothetical protein
VTELRFSRAIYRGTAVDEAARQFADRVQIALVEEPEHWVVRLAAGSPARERAAAGELGNWALGLTVQARQR